MYLKQVSYSTINRFLQLILYKIMYSYDNKVYNFVKKQTVLKWLSPLDVLPYPLELYVGIRLHWVIIIIIILCRFHFGTLPATAWPLLHPPLMFLEE